MLSDDTVSLRHLPRRSSKNCDLQFANGDRFKANYSVDIHLLKAKMKAIFVYVNISIIVIECCV